MATERDLNTDDIFNDLIELKPKDLTPNSYNIKFELDNVKELFEFLLELFTKLSKYYFGDENGQVNLELLSVDDFDIINKYFNAIGFKSNFEILPANAENLNYAHHNRFDRIEITPTTPIDSLIFGLKCKATLYIISFSKY